MIQKDMAMHNDHHEQAIRDLMALQQQLFIQRIERNKYYRRSLDNKNDMEPERNEDWNNNVILQRYDVISES